MTKMKNPPRRVTIKVRLALALLIAAGMVPAQALAATSQTTLSQTVSSGGLGITSASGATMPGVSVSSTAQQTTGNMGAIVVTDSRGSGAGWSAAATASNFYNVNAPVKMSGSNNTVTSAGTYPNGVAGTYTVTITGAGPVGTAQFSVSGLETASAQVTGSNVAIGSRGVTATFASASYAVGDSWMIRVDTIPVTGLTITPSAVTTVSGSSAGVMPGTAHTFTSTNDPATTMGALVLMGMGTYSNAPALTLLVPANTYTNTYTAIVTQTVN